MLGCTMSCVLNLTKIHETPYKKGHLGDVKRIKMCYSHVVPVSNDECKHYVL